MTFDQRVQTAKPYLTGLAIGLVAAPIVAFSAGWVSTSSARTEAVQNARIDTLVSICSANAERLAAAQNTDLTTLKGYQNRDARDLLVGAALIDVEVPEELAGKVASGCNRTLA